VKPLCLQFIIGFIFGAAFSFLIVWAFELDSRNAVIACAIICAITFGVAALALPARRVEKIVEFIVGILNP
jgi:ABC-type antimicrobial peptide transport system permease subunit